MAKEALETNSGNTDFRQSVVSNLRDRPIHLTLTVRRYPSTGKLSTWSGWISTERWHDLLSTLEHKFQLSRIDETDPNG
jgi:hypothetical protein